MKKIILMLAGLFFLAGCSMFSPVKTEKQTSYLLNQMPSVPHKRPSAVSVLVIPAQSNPAYDTTDIAYTTSPYQIGYFANNHWAQRPSEMLQTLIAQALQNTHHYHAVGTSTVLGTYHYVVSFEVVKLLQDYSTPRGMLYLTLHAQILRAADNRIVASREFVITQPIWRQSPYNGIIATNSAAAQAVQQLTQFCLKYT